MCVNEFESRPPQKRLVFKKGLGFNSSVVVFFFYMTSPLPPQYPILTAKGKTLLYEEKQLIFYASIFYAVASLSSFDVSERFVRSDEPTEGGSLVPA